METLFITKESKAAETPLKTHRNPEVYRKTLRFSQEPQNPLIS